MAAETENYGFPKPGEDDFYDIGMFNLAMDKADEAIKAAEEKADELIKAAEQKADSHYKDSNIHITGEEREKWDSSLPKTGDSKDNTVTFNSGDAMSPTGWADVGLISSGEEHKGLWRKVSLIAKNMRYLWKMCGTNDISKLGDGTLTGAVSKLNTDLQYRDISKEAVIINPSVTLSAYIEGGMVYARSFIPANLPEQNGLLFQLPEKYAPRLPVHASVAYFTNADDVGEMVGATVSPDGKVVYYQTHPLVSGGY